MKYLILSFLGSMLLLFSGCAVKPVVENQYQLTGYSDKRIVPHPVSSSILIEAPEAMAGYETADMLYVKSKYELTPFVRNAWVSPPAEMLLPLVVRSITRSGFFRVVASGSSLAKTDYRLNIQLLELQQSFLTQPSYLQLGFKVTLVRTKGNQALASRIFSYKIKATTDTPYGGVVAANQGLRLFTEELTHFIVRQVRLLQAS